MIRMHGEKQLVKRSIPMIGSMEMQIKLEQKIRLLLLKFMIEKKGQAPYFSPCLIRL